MHISGDMPKIELHFHFRGGIPMRAYRRLAKEYYPDMPRAEFLDIFDVGNFGDFKRAYDFLGGLVRTQDDLKYAAGEAAKCARAENVVYAEIWLTPFSIPGVDPRRTLEITREAFKEAGVAVSFIGPFGRHDTLREAEEKYEFYLAARECGIRGVGLMGDEAGHPFFAFAGIFERARRDGFKISVHAGEYRDERNIAAAVRELGADRIGHGNNIRDPRLVDEIVRRGVHIEMCPLSNMKLNSEINPANYDLPRYIEAGISLSINSDDPGILGRTLADNYRFVSRAYGFDERRFREMQREAVRASFADEGTKAALMSKIG